MGPLSQLSFLFFLLLCILCVSFSLTSVLTPPPFSLTHTHLPPTPGKRTWHGPITHCPISVSEKIVREYLELPEGSASRTALERKYGKGTITKLVATWENELANQKWIQDSTMACPGCRVNVEKSLGCNHVSSWVLRCGSKEATSRVHSLFYPVGASFT